MSSSRIVITFGNDIVGGEFLQFDIFRPSNNASSTKRMDFILTPRTGPGQIPVNGNVGVEEEDVVWIPNFAAEQFALYYSLDFLTAEDDIVRINNVVSIDIGENETLGCYLQLQNFSASAGITASIINCVPKSYNISSFVIQETETDKCNHVDMVVQTSEITDMAVNYAVLGGQVIMGNGNTNNPFTLKLARDFVYKLSFFSETGSSINAGSFYVPSFSQDDININVTPLLNLSSVYFDVDVSGVALFETPLVFEYSLDGVNYTSSNSLTAQTIGSYTVYVRDQFGCVKSKDYEVTSLGSREPYLYISKANSITFKEVQEIDDCLVFRNEENSHDKDALNDITYCQETLFNTCDKTRIQFKSNYSNPIVKLRKEQFVPGTPDIPATLDSDMYVEELEVVKQTFNLNRFLSLDCWYYKYADGKVGVYFTNGNMYDEQGLFSGTFALNGNLPDFSIIGQTINLDGLGDFQIKDVVYDARIFRKAFVIDYVFEGDVTQSKATSLFDLLSFEVYEFTVNWQTFGKGIYDIVIENQDTYQDTIFHISENILVEEKHVNVLAIRYFNSNNRDIFYKFGIEHMIRIPFISVESGPLSETEINITDLSTQIVRSSVHELDTFIFDDVSLSIMRKLSVALSCEKVYINGIGYVKQGDISVEPIENTNMYSVKCEMIKTNINYNNNRQGQTGNSIDIPFNIPPFVFGEGGFIKS